MNDFENQFNNIFLEKIKKYEDELSAIKADYEQNQEKIRQELYQKIITEQQLSPEVNKKKRGVLKKRMLHYMKKFPKTVYSHFNNLIKNQK